MNKTMSLVHLTDIQLRPRLDTQVTTGRFQDVTRKRAVVSIPLQINDPIPWRHLASDVGKKL